jgi:hypothetical protein
MSSTKSLETKISENKERLEHLKLKQTNLEREVANLSLKILNQENALRNTTK